MRVIGVRGEKTADEKGYNQMKGEKTMHKINARLVSMTVRAVVVTTFAVMSLMSLTTAVTAEAANITVGKTTSGSGFHIPAYVAMDQGFFKREGLKAKWVAMSGKALLNAGIAKQIDFVPIPGGGSVAALRGAPIIYLVGQSLISQWTITSPKSIKSVKDLKGKTLGLGRPGSADYDEAEIVLGQNFGLDAGKDYKVISFRGEAERIAALINGDIQGAALSFPHAAKAKVAGFKVLLKTGTYLPRVGGSFWTHKDYLKKHRATVKKFIRAIAKAELFMRTHKEETVGVIKKYFAMKDRKEAAGVYDEVYDQYGPDLPESLVKKLFKSRVKRMIKKGNWPKNKPLPDLEQFVARDLLTQTLREMGYYLQAPPALRQ
ncbi:MAG: ABC transporter substrate-binding protein [Candidatus Binatia bacterium]